MKKKKKKGYKENKEKIENKQKVNRNTIVKQDGS